MTHSLIRNKDTPFPTIQLQGIINTTKRGKNIEQQMQIILGRLLEREIRKSTCWRVCFGVGIRLRSWSFAWSCKARKKTATCSGHLFYEKEQEPLPQPGQYAVILDSQEEPKAIIEITHVDVMPMNEVPVSFAQAEGEGDLSYDYWYREHKEFFTEALQSYSLEFKEDMLLVCERFKLIHSAS